MGTSRALRLDTMRILGIASGSLVPALVAVAAMFPAGCSKKAPALVAIAPPAAPSPPDTQRHGEGQGRMREPAVYLDGKPIGVLRAQEMPSSVKPRVQSDIDGMDVPRYFRLYDYVAALGVDVSKIKSIQLYGSHERVAMIEGDELEKFKAALVFDYSQVDRGKARCRWYVKELRTRTHIDNILAMTIYVDKQAPTYDRSAGGLVLDGKAVEGIPYANDDARPTPTRVYVDGHLTGWVKRRTLPDKVIAPSSDPRDPHFSVAAYLSSLGVNVGVAKTVDFLQGDDLVARIDAKALDDGTSFFFTLPRRSKGKVLEHFPGDHAAKVSAVEIFTKVSPPARAVEPEAMEADGKSGSQDDNGGHGDGSPRDMEDNSQSGEE